MKYTNIQQKYADIRNAYDSIVSCGGVNKAYLKRKVIVKVIMEMPAPRFYISAKSAAEYAKLYYSGDSYVLHHSKLPMIKELVEIYEKKRRMHPYTPNQVLWQEVVESPAKSFYATPSLITDIIYFHRNYKDDTRATK